MRQLLNVTQGFVCLTCAANYAQYMTKTKSDTWKLNLSPQTCSRTVNACYDYLVGLETIHKLQMDMIRYQRLSSSKETIQKFTNLTNLFIESLYNWG